MSTEVHKSACNLCSLNCGIEIEVNPRTREFVKITGDKDHPLSQGYLCQKATRINYYQNHKDRLTSPLRKRKDGSFEKISWETAVDEIAAKMVTIRDTYGGKTIAYAGGGGQGNHLGGVYASSFRAACRTPYIYSSLAQEKTGNFWVHGRLFGKQNTMYTEPVAEAEYALIIGANPLQSHGIQRARRVINEISRDPDRTLVVIDPRKTDTAKKADLFLQVLPGKDAWLLSSMIGIIVQNDLANHTFLKEHTTGFETIRPYFERIPVREYAEISGVPFELVDQVARGIAKARTMALRSDLGIEMSYNSTLNAYLARLLFLLTGHFGRKGTNHLTTWFFPLLGHSLDPEDGGVTSQVTQTRGIGKLFPPNILPLEIDSDHPNRIRALVVDSANPMVSWADIPAQRKAYARLDLMVVIDVAMTETALEADYVLPAASQYEKVEATFFQENFFHLRRPILPPLEGTLAEPEIYSRLVRAMGELNEDFSGLEEAAKKENDDPGKGHFQQAMMMAAVQQPSLKKYGPIALKESLGTTLGEGVESAGVLWMTAQMYANKYPEAIRRAGFTEAATELGDAVFRKLVESPSGVKLSQHDYDDHWNLVKHPDNRIHLSIPMLLEWLEDLPKELVRITKLEEDYPFNLIAGERRSYNANTIIRVPEWRKMDAEGAVKIHPEDASRYGVQNGQSVRLKSAIGSIDILAKVTDEVPVGVLSMPHGHGLNYDGNNDFKKVGSQANMLTSTGDCDPLAKTPYHKNVRVKLSLTT